MNAEAAVVLFCTTLVLGLVGFTKLQERKGRPVVGWLSSVTQGNRISYLVIAIISMFVAIIEFQKSDSIGSTTPIVAGVTIIMIAICVYYSWAERLIRKQLFGKTFTPIQNILGTFVVLGGSCLTLYVLMLAIKFVQELS